MRERGRQVVSVRLARRDEEHGHAGVDGEHRLEPLDQLASLLRRAARLDQQRVGGRGQQLGLPGAHDPQRLYLSLEHRAKVGHLQRGTGWS